MGRTKLRGIELAGTRLAVEAPPGCDWDWPARGLARLACSPVEAEVYVGVSVGTVSLPDWDPITYSYDGGTFDVAQVGDEWWVAIHAGGHRFERVARFDCAFSEGEVIVAPGAVETCRHPLDGPLLDLLLTHRIIGAGGLVISGTSVIERGRALALVSREEQQADTHNPGIRACVRRDSASSVQTPGARFCVRMRDGMARVYGLPGSYGHPGAGATGRLDAIHLLTRSSQVFADPVSLEDATHELLQLACAPVHAPHMAEKLYETAETIAETVPMLRLGVPEENRVVPFDWGRREAAFGFALPSFG